MVTAVKNALPSLQAFSQSQILELTGPAGVGKSTLARLLCQRSDKITIGAEIAFRKFEQLPAFVRSIPLVLTPFFLQAASSRWWTWDEIKYLVYLKKWDWVLEQVANSHPGTILLDHGPIFKLATLHAFGPSWLHSTSADAWWSELFQHWASSLDLIVWLDAPDDLLVTRINARIQNHQVKGKTRAEVQQFMARYRSSYHYVLSGLAASNGPNTIQFDTSQASLDEIAEGILAACGLEPETSQ